MTLGLASKWLGHHQRKICQIRGHLVWSPLRETWAAAVASWSNTGTPILPRVMTRIKGQQASHDDGERERPPRSLAEIWKPSLIHCSNSVVGFTFGVCFLLMRRARCCCARLRGRQGLDTLLVYTCIQSIMTCPFWPHPQTKRLGSILSAHPPSPIDQSIRPCTTVRRMPCFVTR